MKRLIWISLAVLTTPTIIFAQRTPLPGRDPLPSGGGVTGLVRLVDCNAGPDNVRITVSNRSGSRSVQPRPLPDNAFVWSYSLTGFSPGVYTVRASMALAFCRGGVWTPTEHTVTVENTLSPVRNVDFDFRGRRIVTRINASLVASLIEGVFRGTQIHLNNFTPRSHAIDGRDSWHLPNDSFLRRSPTMGGRETRFSMEEISRGPLRYYVRDLNLLRVIVRPEADSFRLTLLFENGGPVEIKGRCSNTTASIDPACPVGSDDSAPDFDVSEARIDVHLPPVRNADGDLTYGTARVNFDARLEGGGIGDFFETRVKTSIRSNVEPMILSLIDDANLRRIVARSVRPTLDRFGVGSVASVRFEGVDLVIESYPR
jgi:hypothetical protein